MCSACSGFLDTKPFNSLEQSEFYQTEKQINLATIGLYGTLQDFFKSNYPTLTELPSDNMYSANGSTATDGQFDGFAIQPLNSILSSAWSSLYHSILQCNLLLEKAPAVEYSSPVDSIRFQAEARYVRAMDYFSLVRMFGNVPKVTKPQTVEESRKVVRDSAESIYEEVIIKDLLFAAENLPASYSGNDYGRATKYAALSLLGKVYLTLHRYQDCADALLPVIESKQYSLLPNFADIFDPANAGNAEMIFEVQFEGGNLGEGSRWSFNSHPRDLAGYFGISSTDQGIPTKSIINAMDKQSARYDGSLGTATYKGKTANYVKKHYMDFTVQNSSDDNWPYLRYADILLMYAEAMNETLESPSEEIIEYVNQIRRRAYALPIAGTDKSHDLQAIQVLSRDSFRTAVWEERRLELAFEGHRWFDLVRTGQMVDVMRDHIDSEFNGKYTVHPYNVLFPVPQAQIDINPLLRPNNEGYN